MDKPTREIRDAARALSNMIEGFGAEQHAAWLRFCDAADRLDDRLAYTRHSCLDVVDPH